MLQIFRSSFHSIDVMYMNDFVKFVFSFCCFSFFEQKKTFNFTLKELFEPSEKGL